MAEATAPITVQTDGFLKMTFGQHLMLLACAAVGVFFLLANKQKFMGNQGGRGGGYQVERSSMAPCPTNRGGGRGQAEDAGGGDEGE